jgi:nitroreductase
MIPCIEGKPETSGSSAAFWGSLLPAVWSFMLALRERSMGSAWTTLHLINGGEEQAAELLGIPFDRFSQGGLFPIAYTVGTDFRPASRLPASDLTHWNTWGDAGA